jgi:hypothetical protein
MFIGGALKGLRIERADALARRRHERGSASIRKTRKPEVLMNVRTLVALGIRLCGRSRLTGEVGNDVEVHLLTAFRKSPVKMLDISHNDDRCRVRDHNGM